jgi:glucose/arabinose dehydrogenase
MTKGTVAAMIHLSWRERNTAIKVKCIHTDAKKYIVNNVLTPGKIYDVKNETDEFYFIIDNSGKVGGFYKEYFEVTE